MASEVSNGAGAAAAPSRGSGSGASDGAGDALVTGLRAPASVTTVVLWKTDDLSATRAELEKLVTGTLGGTMIGPWEVTYTAYDQAQPPATRTEQRFNRKPGAQATTVPYLQVVKLGGVDRPFFLARSRELVQADAKLEAVLARALGVAKQRLGGSVEGARYSIGDFTVGIGMLKLQSSYRALVVEATYGPCVSAKAGAAIISEFAFSLGSPDKQVAMSASPDKAQNPGGVASVDHYTHAHTVFQYVRAFSMV